MSSEEKPPDYHGKKAEGRISADPWRNQPIGAEFSFTTLDFGGSDALSRPQGVINWEFFNGALLAVILKSQFSSEMIGTAVMIAPGLAVTASHLFSDIQADLSTGAIVPVCSGIRGGALQMWSVKEMSLGTDDIAFISLVAASEAPDDRQYFRMPLTTRTPRIGENLHIVGFKTETLSSDDGGAKFIGEMLTAVGDVTAVYTQQRDRVLMPYPAIELNCGSMGGMSGGAAIDERGCLVGIISRGFDTVDDSGPTYASWIVSALGRQLKIDWPPGLYSGLVMPCSLSDELLAIQGRDALQVTSEGYKGVTIWHD